MDFEMSILIVFQNWESGIACSSADFKKNCVWGGSSGYTGENWEFLLEPFPVFEEVCGIVLVKVIPPFGRIGIESAFLLSV
jgi:hypothetical protein